MARSLGAKQLQELETLRSKCLAVLDFFEGRSLGSELATSMRSSVQRAYAARDITGLRAGWTDLAEWHRELPELEQQQLARLLQSEAGADIRAERAAEVRRIGEILARGALRTEEEYRLVRGRIDEIYVDPDRADEVHRLNALLRTYSPPTKAR